MVQPGMIPALRRHASPQKPWLDLAFLGLFFLDWFYSPPSLAEAGWSVLALGGFLAAYIFAMRRMDGTVLAAAAIAMATGFAILPLNVGGAVFIVYAAGMTARLPDLRLRTAGLAAVALAILAGGLLLGFQPLWLVALIGLAGFVALSTGWSARSGEREARARAARVEAERAAAEAERGRIARDLHDLLGHSLSVIALKAELAERLSATDTERARSELAEIAAISRAALAEVREAVAGLRARSLSETLKDVAGRLEGAGLRVARPGAAPDLPAAAGHVLSMALREAATNILRHAGARQVEIAIQRDEGAARLVVRDDGRGGAIEGGGLRGLRARLEEAGGQLKVTPGPDGIGVRLEAVLPVDKPKDVMGETA